MGVGNTLMLLGASGSQAFFDTNFNYGTPNPSGSYTNTASANQCGPIVGGSFTAAGTTGTTITVTQCYGNCGSPAITLANTNSTHTINFNQSITLLYEFQSNLNGFVQNYTLNYAAICGSGSKCTANTLYMALYTIPSCPLGQTPFGPQCPGLRVSQGSNGPPSKARISFVASNVAVSNGQWVGIGVSGTFNGIDINDTNTNVNLFQTNEGTVPPSISQAVAVAGTTSKMGAWAWIKGNGVTGGPPTSGGSNFNCPGFLDCLLPNWVSSFCFNQSAACLNASGLIWAMIFAGLSTFILAKYGSELMPGVKLPFGEIFLLFSLVFIFVMAGLSLIFVWVPLFFFFVVSILIGKKTGTYL